MHNNIAPIKLPEKKINIVMVSDVDWQSMYVAVKSILESSNDVRELCFHFLVSDSFDTFAENNIKSLCNKSEVLFYRVEKLFLGLEVEQRVSWIKYVTYYRLAIPQVIQAEKCLYMDTDIVVCEDLRQFYDTDIKDYYIGGIFAIGYHTNDNEYFFSVGLPSNDSYINAGVMLMNLDNMRKNKVSEKMMNMIIKRYPGQDQDIINIACYKHIKKLPFRYNTMTKYFNKDLSCYKECYDSLEVNEAWNNPTIIHYADSRKPWSSLECPLAYRWWSVCRDSIVEEYFYNLIRDAVYIHIFSGRNERNIYEWNVMVLKRIESSPMVLMYGAGKVATSCFNELNNLGISINYVIQTNHDERDDFNGIPLISFDELQYIPKEAAFIIAVNPVYEMEIIQGLNKKGFFNIIRLDDGKIEFYNIIHKGDNL